MHKQPKDPKLQLEAAINKTRRIAIKNNMCCLCFGPLAMPDEPWKGGHNAQPVFEGRCCAICNESKVIPARLKRLGWH